MSTLEPFNLSLPQILVASSLSLADRNLDLKAAALFYDRIIILHDDLFRFKLEDAVGQDLDYLENSGIIEILTHDLEGETEQEYLEGRGIFAMSLFASEGTVVLRSLPRQASNGCIRARASRELYQRFPDDREQRRR